MADDDITDLSAFVPDHFKSEDGKYDTAKFRADYDGAVSYRSQEEERKATLPKDPSELAFGLPEGHKWPEGFDPAKMTTKDEQGREVQFDVSKLIDEKDPDVPALQAILHKAGVPASVMKEVASVVVNREIRAMMAASKEADDQIAALGPDGKARISTVTHALNQKLPAAQATAILDGITTADALRAVEALIKAPTTPVIPAEKTTDLSQMSRVDRIAAGLQQMKRA